MPFTEPDPAVLRTPDFLIRPITVADTERDHAAVMATREPLRLWRQSTWPEDDFTVEANRADLAEMEERHLAGRAFSYTVLDPTGSECLGCVYLYPTSATFLTRATVTPLTDLAWSDVDSVAFFWARLPLMHSGADARLLSALRTWFTGPWHFRTTVYVTSEPFTQQVALLEEAGLTPAFHLHEPATPAKRIAFA